MIKGVIFDWGGVLTHQGRLEDVIDDFAKKFKADAHDTLKRAMELWRLSRTGEKPSGHFWEGLGKHLNAETSEVRKHLVSLFEFNHEMFEFAKRLKRHYKLGLLSNQIEDWLEEEIEKYEFRKLFDVIVGSYAVKLRKPDEAIYRYITQELNLTPEECVFIDDQEANIDAAKKIGMKGIVFTDIVHLQKELASLGVTISEI